MISNQKLQYESGAVQLDDGRIFQPLNDAINRWISSHPASYRMLGREFDILYELPEGRFIHIYYPFCDVQHGIWCSDESPKASEVEKKQALEFLLQNNFDVPESLSHLITGVLDSESSEQLQDQAKEEPMPTENARKVFVIHGRNDFIRQGLFTFLRAIDLQPLEWNQLVQATGSGSPYIGQVLDAAFEQAQAVVALVTPDDLAMLKTEFQHPNDHDYEKNPTGQARPNVLFEAGMAFGRFPDRTIIVEVGSIRPFSDVGGRHSVRLTNKPEKRKDLADRLRTCGCQVDMTGSEWMSAGDFVVADNRVHEEWSSEMESAQPSLSGEATDLLLEASHDKTGQVVAEKSMQGFSVHTNGRYFVKDTMDPRLEAVWKDAVAELEKADYLTSVGQSGLVYRVTTPGYTRADAMKSET